MTTSFNHNEDHYIVNVDGDEMIRDNGTVWDGINTYHLAIENEPDARIITLYVYRKKFGCYIRQATHTRG